MDIKGMAAAFLICVAVVLALWLLPLATIWAINALFGLGIGYTFKTWAASLILFGVLAGSRAGK